VKVILKTTLTAASLGLCVLASAAQAQNLVTNGGFTGGLASWTAATSTDSAAGTCAYNGDTQPGTETVTGSAGFTTANASLALGSASLTAAGFRSCVLYQDIAIPVGATTLTLSGDFGRRAAGTGVVDNDDRVIVVGVYPTASVPNLSQRPLAGTDRLIVSGANNTALAPVSIAAFSVAPYAGTTIRLAIINSIRSTVLGTGAPVVDGYSVIGASNVQAVVVAAPAPVPTLSEWAMILFGLILAGGAALYIQRRQMAV
jgi:hypothetical protein